MKEEEQRIIDLGDKLGEPVNIRQAKQWLLGKSTLSRLFLKMLKGRVGPVTDHLLVDHAISAKGPTTEKLVHGADIKITETTPESFDGSDAYELDESAPTRKFKLAKETLEALTQEDLSRKPEESGSWGKLASDTAPLEEFDVRYVGDAPGVRDSWKKKGREVSVCVDEVAYLVGGVGLCVIEGERCELIEGGVVKKL